MRLAPAAQNKSPPSESANHAGRTYNATSFARYARGEKRETEREGAPPSRGPRLFARNIRRVVGPPS